MVEKQRENHRYIQREVETETERGTMEAGGWCEVKMDGFEASVYDLWILFYEKADFSGGGRSSREGRGLSGFHFGTLTLSREWEV